MNWNGIQCRNFNRRGRRVRRGVSFKKPGHEIPKNRRQLLDGNLGPFQLLKRPEITVEQLAAVLRNLVPRFFERYSSSNSAPSAVEVSALDAVPVHLSSEIRNELKSVETEIKYAGYLDQQHRAIERLKKAEQRRIPDWFDYRAVSGLSREMQEKLGNVIPQTLGQASRIPGVTPAAVSLINVYIEIQARRREQAAGL